MRRIYPAISYVPMPLIFAALTNILTNILAWPAESGRAAQGCEGIKRWVHLGLPEISSVSGVIRLRAFMLVRYLYREASCLLTWGVLSVTNFEASISYEQNRWSVRFKFSILMSWASDGPGHPIEKHEKDDLHMLPGDAYSIEACMGERIYNEYAARRDQ